MSKDELEATCKRAAEARLDRPETIKARVEALDPVGAWGTAQDFMEMFGIRLEIAEALEKAPRLRAARTRRDKAAKKKEIKGRDLDHAKGGRH